MGERSDRMIQSAPSYYHYNNVYIAIQENQAGEYDNVQAKNDDLSNQLYIARATWGLKYWEAELLILTIEADSYAIRRSRVLSKWRAMTSQFSAALIKSICEAFSGGEVAVAVDIPARNVLISFVGTAGIPTNISDLKAAVENVIHAHLGTQYTFTYTTWDKLEAAAINFNTLGTYTWDQLETAFAL
jgi:hypothetical protein